MALSLLHQTVNPVGASFTPNLTLNGWFTLYWDRNNNLLINAPTGLANGQEFVMDIIRSVGSGDGAIEWNPFYSGHISQADDSNSISPWGGGGSLRARRMEFLYLNGIATMRSMNYIVPY